MKLKQLNKRERILAGAIIAVIIIGTYGLLRFQPYQAEIEQMQSQMDRTLNRISTMDIPQEPQEDIDDIMAELEDEKKALDAIRDNARQIESQLAPEDSQELRVRISELARDSGIRIRVNESLRPSRVGNGDEEIIPPPSAGWIKRLSPGSMFSRPLQRLEIDGDYPSLRRFIHGLDELPYLVTVVRMNISKLEVPPMPGMSQLLKTELVLAL